MERKISLIIFLSNDDGVSSALCVYLSVGAFRFITYSECASWSADGSTTRFLCDLAWPWKTGRMRDWQRGLASQRKRERGREKKRGKEPTSRRAAHEKFETAIGLSRATPERVGFILLWMEFRRGFSQFLRFETRIPLFVFFLCILK